VILAEIQGFLIPEADDFDPSAQVTDKLVTLGLDVKKDVKEVNVKQDSKATPATSNSGELTEKEKLEKQVKSDQEIAMDLFGWYF
jgi:hypothetical protein